MNVIDDGVKFLEDLILGDFNEQQMVSAQVVAGLISLIPVADQVMDVRDVSGCLYRINKHGGLGKASIEQKIDLGFAAFGVLPTVGSAFKTVFKPLYKQRKAAKGLVNGGVAMIERMLGQKKGGAVRWLRALDWAGETQAAIIQANLALDSCIAMVHYLGQSHWWCPDRVEGLALDVAPSLESMRGKLAEPIREASAEIKAFLEELLGEHAAAVAMAVATSVPLQRRAPQTSQHRPALRAPAPQTSPHGPALRAPNVDHITIGDVPRSKKAKRQGTVVNEVQRVAFDLYKGLDFMAKGLLGEHIVEYHIIEQKKWGIDWNRHDMFGPDRDGRIEGWQNRKFRKLNDDEIPSYLCIPRSRVVANGINSFWSTNRAHPQEFAVVEAKANMNPNAQLYHMLGDARSQPPGGENGADRGSGRKNRRNKPGTTVKDQSVSGAKDAKDMQMSREWITTHLIKSFPSLRNRVVGNYTRHVFLVSPLQAASHVKAIKKIIEDGFVGDPTRAQIHAPMHEVHDVQKEFGETDLDDANEKYKPEGKHKPKKNQISSRRERINEKFH